MNPYMVRLASDLELQAFVAAEVARAHVELQALRVEHVRDLEAIAALKAENAELRKNQRSDRRHARRMTDEPSERRAG